MNDKLREETQDYYDSVEERDRKMNEFEELLEEKIEKKMNELEELQKKYRKLTGKNFIKPLRW